MFNKKLTFNYKFQNYNKNQIKQKKFRKFSTKLRLKIKQVKNEVKFYKKLKYK